MNILKQRRIQAGIAGSIILVTTMSGIELTTDITTLTEQISDIVIALSALATTLLPVLSFFYPKK